MMSLNLHQGVEEEQGNDSAAELSPHGLMSANAIETENELPRRAMMALEPAANSYLCDSTFIPTKQFACFYTKHKTQKHKIWLDGRLVVSGTSCTASLHSADPAPGSGDPILDEVVLLRMEVEAIVQQHRRNIETEKYLIVVESLWVGVNPISGGHVPSTLPIVSNGMRKVISRKFRKPTFAIPPPPPQHPTQRCTMPESLRKRRRPLQPGELVQQYYPTVAVNGCAGPAHGSPSDRLPYSPYVPPGQHSGLIGMSHTGGNRMLHAGSAPTQQHPRGTGDHGVSEDTSSRSLSNQPTTIAATHTPHIAHENRQYLLPERPQLHGDGAFGLSQGNQCGPSDGSRTANSEGLRQSTNPFTNNGFNASNFYGEDFDDEEDGVDEMTGHPEVFQLQQPRQLATSRSPQVHDDPRPGNTETTASDEARPMHLPSQADPEVPVTDNTEKACNKTDTLSTTQLLALFDVDNNTNNAATNQGSGNCDDEFVLPLQEVSSDED